MPSTTSRAFNLRTPIIIGISLSPTFIPALERSAEVLRARHPGIDDAQLMERLLVHGLISVIDMENNSRVPRSEYDDTVCALAEALL